MLDLRRKGRKGRLRSREEYVKACWGEGGGKTGDYFGWSYDKFI